MFVTENVRVLFKRANLKLVQEAGELHPRCRGDVGEDGQLAPPRRRSGRPKTDASREAFKRSSDVLFADKTTPPASGESWWLGITDRVKFNRRAAEETERMQTSKFGRMKGNVPESPA